MLYRSDLFETKVALLLGCVSVFYILSIDIISFKTVMILLTVSLILLFLKLVTTVRGKRQVWSFVCIDRLNIIRDTHI